MDAMTMKRPKMPGLASLQQRFAQERPLEGYGVLLHMHMTPETVTLGELLDAGAATVVYLPSNRNPSPTAVVERAKAHGGIVVETLGQLNERPTLAPNARQGFLVVEGNGRLFTALHQEPQATFSARIRGISEHTSGGGRQVDAFDPTRLRVPVTAVYKNPLKALLETGLGTSQTVTAAFLRGLKRPVAGRRAIVVGFGNVGQGVARTLRALGACVTVVEKRMEGRLEARLQGFAVADLAAVLPATDLCLTAVGAPSILTAAVLENAKAGIVLATAGNEPREIDLQACHSLGTVAPHLEAWQTPEGKQFLVLGGGLQVNHVIEEGNPAELMDLSFSLHALALCWLVTEKPGPGVYAVTAALREEVAALVLGGLA